MLTSLLTPYRIPLFRELKAHEGGQTQVWLLTRTSLDHPWTDLECPLPHRYLRSYRVGSRYQGRRLYLAPAVVRLLRRSECEVVVCGGYDHPTYWLALLTGRLLKKRVLLWSETTALDARPNGSLALRLKRSLVSRFDGFIVPGLRQLAYVRGLCPSSGAPAWLVRNCVDSTFYQIGDARHLGACAPEQRGEVVFLYVGRLIDAKGIPELLEAFGAIRGRLQAKLMIAGTGPQEQKYRQTAAERGLRVEFLGFVQATSLPKVYEAADVFVFPTRSDPWGLVVNEAMASGLPVISSSVAGAAPDLVAHGVTGYQFESGDVKGLTRWLLALGSDAGLRRQMGRAAQVLIADFSPDVAARGFAAAVRGDTSRAA